MFWPICMIFMPNMKNLQRIGSLNITFDLLISMAGFFLIVMGRGPGAARLRLRPLDMIVVLMMLAHTASVTVNQGFLPTYLPQIPFIYYLPYALGRLYLRDTNDLAAAMGMMCRVLAVACFVVVLEGASRLSIIYYLAHGGFRPMEVRYGFGRASLGLEHPIGLGCVLLLTLPWALEARRWSRDGAGPRWWKHATTLVFVSLLMTVSRGPIMGAIIALLADRYFQRPRLRTPLLILGITAGLTFYFANDAITEVLTTILKTGTSDFYETTIMIDGQPYIYNGTTHRSLLYIVYREPMQLAGAFGFDRGFVKLTPPNLRMFWSIDNHYIMTRLSKGYVGLIMIDLLLVTTIVSASRLALKQPDHPMAGLAGSISASVIGLSIVMFSVILFRESAAMLLFSAGLVASFRDLPSPQYDGFEFEFDEDPDDEEIEEPDSFTGDA